MNTDVGGNVTAEPDSVVGRPTGQSLLTSPVIELNESVISELKTISSANFIHSKTEHLKFVSPNPSGQLFPFPNIHTISIENLQLDGDALSFLSDLAVFYPTLTCLRFSRIDWPICKEFKDILLDRFIPSRWMTVQDAVARWYCNDFGELSVHAKNHSELFMVANLFAQKISYFHNLIELRFDNSPYLGCAWKPMTLSSDPPQTFWGLVFQLVPKTIEVLAINNSGLYDETFLSFPPLFSVTESYYPNLKRLCLGDNHISDIGLRLLLTYDACAENVGLNLTIKEINLENNLIQLESKQVREIVEKIVQAGVDIRLLCPDENREETKDWEMVAQPSPKRESDWMIDDDDENDSDFEADEESTGDSVSGSDSSESSGSSSGYESEGSDLLKLLDDEE